MEAAAAAAGKPKLLFVDDEQRVLNSMRIMFRRDYELYLASHGAEALQIIRDNNIDVIVADHRMPQMTGVEVLTAVRSMSPRTVRILLTGYADLDAVEGSINDSEVFRFLTKPCAPKELRTTIQLAAKVAQDVPAPPASAPEPEADEEAVEIILESDSVTEIGPASAPEPAAPTMPKPVRPSQKSLDDTDVMEHPPPVAAAPPPPVQPTAAARNKLGVLVFTADADVLSSVQQAVRARIPVYHATNIVQVVKLLTEHRPGVLLTDVSEDRNTIQSMTARLKEHLPELVTIAVSAHRDVLDMVWLINHGQIFRFLRKPLSPGRCAVSLQAALKHHRMLLKHPELIRRHELEDHDTGDGGLLESMLQRLKELRRRWVSA